MITTCILYHPFRPLKCLLRALKTLNNATKLEHHVELIVQGLLPKGVNLPDPGNYQNIKLSYFYNKENLGIATPLAQSIKRFLKTDHKWWAKFDDDMSFENGGWDLAIEALDNEDNIGEHNCSHAMLAVPSNMWSGKPRIFYIKNKTLLWHHKSYTHRNVGLKPEYIICDHVDIGCTIYKRAVFEAGCIFDSNYFIGCINFDMSWQLYNKKFKAIMVINPRSNHHHGECKPFRYGAIRYDPRQINKSANYFEEKWGIKIPHLANFKGLNRY
jgi:GT2 family glycosyltransferase